MKNKSSAMFDARFCPRCGGRNGVKSACLKGTDYVRYRKCPECYYTFKTIEIPVLYKALEEYDEHDD